MNPTQINESISAGIYAKNITFAKPFSKGAYLEFRAQWKETYARLSKAIRANKELVREWQRSLTSKPKLTEEQETALKEQAKFELPSSLGFVSITPPYSPGWWPTTWRLRSYAHFLLVLRKQMKVEAEAQYQASQVVSGQPDENAFRQSNS
jgi:hypothetical protein